MSEKYRVEMKRVGAFDVYLVTDGQNVVRKVFDADIAHEFMVMHNTVESLKTLLKKTEGVLSQSSTLVALFQQRADQVEKNTYPPLKGYSSPYADGYVAALNWAIEELTGKK